MAEDKPVTVKMTKTEALALLKAAETGLAVVEALNLVPNRSAMIRAVRLLRDQMT